MITAKLLRSFFLSLIFFAIVVLFVFIKEVNRHPSFAASLYETEGEENTVRAAELLVNTTKLEIRKNSAYPSDLKNESTASIKNGNSTYATKPIQQITSTLESISEQKNFRELAAKQKEIGEWAAKQRKSGEKWMRHAPGRLYESIPATWPPPVHWPDTWIRLNSNDDPFDQSGREIPRAIVCNLTQISDNLQPKLPVHFEKRKFKSLPPRYSEIAQPWPAPTCGNSGMPSPWKLVKLQQTKDAEQRKLWMLFIVKSAPGYSLNRQTVRETWGAADEFKNHPVFVLFVVGKSTNESINENIRKESKTFGDILECDFIDHYRMLPTKVLATFRWFLERDFDIQFFSMTDDDCLINLPNVVDFFDKTVTTSTEYYKNVYCGFHHDPDSLISRKSKWAVTKEQYSGDIYPTFCHGGLWTLARPLMLGLYCVSEITKIGDFFLEDVLLTGILRHKLNFKDTNIKRVVRKTTKEDKLLFFHGAPKKDADTAHDAVLAEWEIWKRRQVEKSQT